MPISVVNRNIIISGDFDANLANRFFEEFLTLDQITADITIVITGSQGGDWDVAGLAMMQLILSSENNIISHGYGEISSSAAMVWLAADVRTLFKGSLLLFHTGNASVEDLDTKEFTKMAHILERQNAEDYEYLSSRSNKPPSFWREKMQNDAFIFPEEALELELIHKII